MQTLLVISHSQNTSFVTLFSLAESSTQQTIVIGSFLVISIVFNIGRRMSKSLQVETPGTIVWTVENATILPNTKQKGTNELVLHKYGFQKVYLRHTVFKRSIEKYGVQKVYLSHLSLCKVKVTQNQNKTSN